MLYNTRNLRKAYVKRNSIDAQAFLNLGGRDLDC